MCHVWGRFRFLCSGLLLATVMAGAVPAPAADRSAAGAAPVEPAIVDPSGPVASTADAPTADPATLATVAVDAGPDDDEALTLKPAAVAPLEGLAVGIATAVEADDRTITLADSRAAAAAVRDFYRGRDYAPVWLTGGAVNRRGDALRTVLAAAAREGLVPDDYTLPATPAAVDEDALVATELRYTLTLLQYGKDLNAGRIDPKRVDSDHFVHRDDPDLAGLLEGAAAAANLAAYLESLTPPSTVYRGLRRGLREYRALAAAGGWGTLPDGPTLKPGMRDPRVRALRAQLRAMGLLNFDRTAPDLYDNGLALAVESFQRRHGLTADGAVGPKTREALNVPVDQRVRQILLNMERSRWLPPVLGDAYVFVNMAGFELDVVDSGSIALSMKVVVGKPYRQTPAFSGQISYLEFNPYWHVPYSIATKDILPKAQNDPGYLANQGIRVLAGGSEVSPDSVDWSALGRGNFPYRLRQDPGRSNALGRVKFMFPNRHSVYLHDTPSRSLFQRTERAFSSGCIRLEKPLDLAEYLLGDDGWSRQRIEALIAGNDKTSRVVRLSVPVPVHLVYLTAFPGRDGVVQFRNDVYGRDERLATALFGVTH